MIRARIGQSENIDTLAAIETAITQCRKQLADLQPQAGIIFCGFRF
ncbi:hypothetical protein D1AOALGA4SA_10065 [Olavius algarvensis Delta 1 endosymbiont]|nr:hypothetical protein D1AOALGA4SA_10065 [Olavius algarvensis Delta 1 endosymbiont]